MRIKDILSEKWTKKYKRSIDCENPKGFSQKAHCDGRNKKTNEDVDNNNCPKATQDIKLNTENREKTIKEYDYGPLNFDFPGDYWEEIADYWDTTEEAAMNSLCGNCVAFDISPKMKDCMPGETSDEDGELGYCWMHHFKCHSARTCKTWAKGGPITDNDVSDDWNERAFPKEEKELDEDLRAWFGKGKKGGAGGGGWDRYNTKGERVGKCGDSKPGEGKPKCLSKSRAASLRASGGKKAIGAAVRKKKREDPNKNRKGKAKNVKSRTRTYKKKD